jgi:two-component system OmpR family sensor kinase
MGALPRRIGTRISEAFDRLPIRVRLAAASALLTFAILCSFALIVGVLTAHRLRADFDRQVSQTDEKLASKGAFVNLNTHAIELRPALDEQALPEHWVVEVLNEAGTVIARWPNDAPVIELPTPAGSSFVRPFFRFARGPQMSTVDGYRVASEPGILYLAGLNAAYGRITVEYARPLSSVNATIARVELLLLLGVLGGSGLALLAGMAIARRAMSPIAALTSTAEKIARTRDSSLRIPQPKADDEVAELARTLAGMLRELDSAQAETEATLARQRQFVADASHELRTPLTSVLANLELLVETLHGEQGEAARSALRSSKRMRRLVADLLLLARSDVGRVVQRKPTDLAQVAIDAAAELGPMSATHELTLDARPAVVDGSRDDLDRVAINLIENAIRHTPPGTTIWVSTALAGEHATLVVEDNGPGISGELGGAVFERFVRGGGEGGGSFGLGLAIVRAVIQAHGGTVRLERTRRDGTDHGARFVITLPAASRAAANGAGTGAGAAAQPVGASDLHDDR